MMLQLGGHECGKMSKSLVPGQTIRTLVVAPLITQSLTLARIRESDSSPDNIFLVVGLEGSERVIQAPIPFLGHPLFNGASGLT